MSGDPVARTETMARILNVSTVHLGRLAKSGTIPEPISRGRWNVIEVVRSYIDNLKAKGDEPAESVKSEELRLITARREKTEAEAAAQEMKNAQMRGELLLREDVDAVMTATLARVRARLIGVPSKAAPLVMGLEAPAEAEAVIRKAVYEALKELSETSVSDLGGYDDGLVEGAGAAAGPDGESVGGRASETQP